MQPGRQSTWSQFDEGLGLIHNLAKGSSTSAEARRDISAMLSSATSDCKLLCEHMTSSVYSNELAVSYRAIVTF